MPVRAGWKQEWLRWSPASGREPVGAGQSLAVAEQRQEPIRFGTGALGAADPNSAECASVSGAGHEELDQATWAKRDGNGGMRRLYSGRRPLPLSGRPHPRLRRQDPHQIGQESRSVAGASNTMVSPMKLRFRNCFKVTKTREKTA